MSNGNCVVGARHDADIVGLQKETARLHEVDDQQWTAINQIRNRLPTWATLLLGILMGVIGWLASALK